MTHCRRPTLMFTMIIAPLSQYRDGDGGIRAAATSSQHLLATNFGAGVSSAMAGGGGVEGR